MISKRRLLFILFWLLMLPLYNVSLASEYGFPIKNPFFATIASSPPEYQPKLMNDSDIQQLLVTIKGPRKKLPGNLWDVESLIVPVAYQQVEAPLIFVIAGTGSSYKSQKMQFLKKIFYQAGFHVALLSSPTNYDFIVAAPQARPGLSKVDANDLYKVMKQVVRQLKNKNKVKITDYLLVGYSLGALQAAFVSHLDITEKHFEFEKVILINPPVNLYTSLQTLDKLTLAKAYKVNNAEDFFNLIFDKLASFFGSQGYIKIEEGLFFDIQGSGQALTREEMALLIAASFRFSVAEMSFMVDQLNKHGVYVAENIELDISASLTDYFKQALLCNFACYLNKFVMPYVDKSLAEVIKENSLEALQNYLAQSSHIYVMTNKDDFILSNQDIEFLIKIFGERLTLYPYGGHCGNLNYQKNVDDLLKLLKSK
ncbi:serine/threonine protein kinase [Spartinivicinus ruber]|uniref:serine/threonine protein kinase n=1 Tax=Spartinivicinus ruber TaxID=2683272 RepID=UPI0013D838E1|nr:serine/threonine protein kinase [Spartinivicinus ruber]